MATKISGKQIATETLVDASTLEENGGTLRVKAGGITNDHISATAAIAQSKLALSIRDDQVAADANIAMSKLNLAIKNSEVADDAGIAHTKLAISSGTGVDIDNDGVFSIGQAVATTSNVTFNNVTVGGALYSNDITATAITASGDLTVTGNLTVSGNQTIVNSGQIDLADSILTLNSDLGSGVTATEDGGFIINRGSDTDAKLLWDENLNKWVFGLDGNLDDMISYGDFAPGNGLSYSDTGDNAGTFAVVLTQNGGLSFDLDGKIQVLAKNGIQKATDGALEAKLDGGSLAQSGTGLKVAEKGIASAQLNATRQVAIIGNVPGTGNYVLNCDGASGAPNIDWVSGMQTHALVALYLNGVKLMINETAGDSIVINAGQPDEYKVDAAMNTDAGTEPKLKINLDKDMLNSGDVLEIVVVY